MRPRLTYRNRRGKTAIRNAVIRNARWQAYYNRGSNRSFYKEEEAKAAEKRRKQAHYAELDQRRLNKQTRKSESVSTSAVIMKTSRLSLKLLFGVSGLALALTLSAMPAGFWPGFLLIIGALSLAALLVLCIAFCWAYAFGNSNVGFGFFIGGN